MPRRPDKLPPGVRRRPGRPYEIFYPGPDGRRVQETLGTDLREAVRVRAERIAEVRAGTWIRADQRRRESLTFDQWADTWLERRAARPNPPRTLHDDIARLRDHLRPVLGPVRLDAITVDHVRRVLAELRAKTSKRTGRTLAENTITNTFGTLSKCLRDAAKELGRHGVAWVPPVDQLDDDELPVLVDRPREGFQREELESLLTDARIPEERRVFWALLGLTGMRHNEAAGLRWSDVDLRTEPLARIVLTQQAGGLRLKEDKRGRGLSREIPVHPTLRAVLERWRTHGFAETFGRHPRPGDYISPRPGDVTLHRLNRTSLGQLRRDCKALAMPVRCPHTLRNTFATLASVDAPELEAVIAGITHQTKPVRGAFRTYVATQSRWLARCAAVQRLDIVLVRHADVVELPKVAAASLSAPDAASSTTEGSTSAPGARGASYGRVVAGVAEGASASERTSRERRRGSEGSLNDPGSITQRPTSEAARDGAESSTPRVTSRVTPEEGSAEAERSPDVARLSAVAHAVVRPAVLGALAKARRGEAERVHEGGGRVGHGRPPARRARVDRVEAESCEAKRTPSAKLHDSEKPSGRA